jgi:HK97 family phage prohead protease
MSDEPLLIRQFAVELEESDGRTLEGRVVPYGVSATVGDPPDYRPYEEAFVRGAFAGAVKAPNRVYLTFEHDLSPHPAPDNIIGHGVEFEERDDALYGRFRVLDDPGGEKARLLIREKILGAMSVEFKPLSKPRIVNGVVQRLKVHLDRVALVRQGSYPGAEVLALRHKLEAEDEEPVWKPEHLPRFDPEMADSLARYVKVPASLRGQLTHLEPPAGFTYVSDPIEIVAEVGTASA